MFLILYRQFLAILVVGLVIGFPVQIVSAVVLSWTLGAQAPVAQRSRLQRIRDTPLTLAVAWFAIVFFAVSVGYDVAVGSLASLLNTVAQCLVIAIPPVGVVGYLLLGIVIYRARVRQNPSELWADALGENYRSRLWRLCAAHSIRRVNSLWWTLVATAPTVWGLGAVITADPENNFSSLNVVFLAAMCMCVTAFVLVFLRIRVVAYFRPHAILVDLGLTAAATSARRTGQDDLPLGSNDWRTPQHHYGFVAARSLERYLPGFRRRLSTSHFNKVTVVCERLAAELRRQSVDGLETEDGRSRLNQLLRSTAGMVSATNPVAVADRIVTLLPDATSSISLRRPARKRLGLLGARLHDVGDGVDAVHKVIVVVAIVIVLVALLSQGHLAALISHLESFK